MSYHRYSLVLERCIWPVLLITTWTLKKQSPKSISYDEKVKQDTPSLKIKNHLRNVDKYETKSETKYPDILDRIIQANGRPASVVTPSSKKRWTRT